MTATRIGTASVTSTRGVNLHGQPVAPRKRRKDAAPVSEAAFQKRVIEFAHLHGWRVVTFEKRLIQRKNGTCYWATPFGADGKGFLDLLLTRRSRLVFAECKVKGGRVSPEQRAWHEALRATGADVFLFTPEAWNYVERVLTDWE